MGVPKRKTSKSRRDKRRANDFLTAVNVSKCPQCSEMRLPHRVCPTCGYYHDRLVLPSEDEE